MADPTDSSTSTAGTPRPSSGEAAQALIEDEIEMAAAEAEVRALDLLNHALKGAGRSEVDLAEAFSVTPQRVTRLLNGEDPLSLLALARLLRASGYRLALRAEPMEDGLPDINPQPRRRRVETDPR